MAYNIYMCPDSGRCPKCVNLVESLNHSPEFGRWFNEKWGSVSRFWTVKRVSVSRFWTRKMFLNAKRKVNQYDEFNVERSTENIQKV